MKIIVNVTPRASRQKITKQPAGPYRVKLTAAPVDGKANEQLLQLISEEWQVAKSRIRIVRGERGRRKVIEII